MVNRMPETSFTSSNNDTLFDRFNSVAALMRSPDRTAALAQYARRARFYDLELIALEPIRTLAISRLRLNRGDTVIDVGCGTGLSLAPLRRRVGAEGKIIAIEQSADMIERARGRVRRYGWDNIELLQAPVEDAQIPSHADAALFHFTHDILRTPAAVENVVEHLKPGARLVASGLKWARPMFSPANLMVLPAAMMSVTSLEGLTAPWSNLAKHADIIDVEPLLGDGAYIAIARRRDAARR